jgi:(p)ppGpp synthase/HD superfamily hydrolase
VIEDTEHDYSEIHAEFGQDVADLVHEVTHEGQKDSKGFYFPRLRTPRGIQLKFADRLSNLSRMEPWSERRVNHYLHNSRFWRTGNEKRFR